MTTLSPARLPTAVLALLLMPVSGCDRPLVGWPLEDTGGDHDAPPTVSATIPSSVETDAALSSALVIVFSEPMDAMTLGEGSIVLFAGDVELAGSVTPAGSAALFDPDLDLLPGTLYTATVRREVSDTAGNPMVADYTWAFQTGVAIDDTRPRVIATSPMNGADGVPMDAIVSATFSEPMDRTSLSASTFDVTGFGGDVMGTVDYDADTEVATFVPDAALTPGSTYVARVGSAASDLSGNTMVEDYSWVFFTGLLPRDLEPVALRSLEAFVAVSGAGLTNSNGLGTTTLNGNVGLSPIATCLGDGLPCTATDPIINFTLYANDSEGVAAEAKADLSLALADANSRPAGTAVQNVSGMTLLAGVYTSGSTLQLDSGETLILDAAGDADAVWIFQVPASMTIHDDASVVLVNGASAENVFWAVGASTTLGSNVSFQGTVLSEDSNSIGANSALVGRVFSSSGGLTLLSDNLTLPWP